MGVEFWFTLVSALVGGGGLIGSLILLPKLRAETRKINTEVDDMTITRLYAELDRLDREITKIRDRARTRETELERDLEQERKEKRELAAKVKRLEARVRAMESVFQRAFKAERTSGEWSELLKQIDDAEAKMNRRRK